MHPKPLLLLCVVYIFVTQLFASTPAIRDSGGNEVDGSIAKLQKISLNGREEWISIRGHSLNNPVLLFLAGGPGGTQMAAVRHSLGEFERHFIVVNWDQPGSGKSYQAVSREGLTKEMYIEDGLALTEYLCREFSQEKIFLMGESWGSALGIFMADKNPDRYHAMIGTGQMVDFLQTELTDYHLALSEAREAGNAKLLATLEENGEPPYYGKDVTWKSAAYLNYLSRIMARNPEITNSGYDTFRDIGSAEYGIIDKINFFRAVINTFNQVYPQLYDTDLRTDYPTLEIPVWFFLGRHDINAPVAFAEEYYEIIDAPSKHLVWFEHSGHSPWLNESDLFIQETLRVKNSLLSQAVN